MSAEEEPSKQLLPFLQRAAELQTHDRRIAYYCRLHAMETGLKIPAKERTKETNALLLSIMGTLEKDKKAVSLSPDDNMYVEGFAQNVFVKADKVDRAGRADLKTAKTFYAASIFFEVCRQFGLLPQDLEQKQKYAIWKAADIRKAVAEGRTPTPGPPGGDPDEYPSTRGDNQGGGPGDYSLSGQSGHPTGSSAPPSGPPPPTAAGSSQPPAPAFDEFGLPIAPSRPVRLDSYGSFSKEDAPQDLPKPSQPAFPPGYATRSPPPNSYSHPPPPSAPSGYQHAPPPNPSQPPQGYPPAQSHPPPQPPQPPFQFPSVGPTPDNKGPDTGYPSPPGGGYQPPPSSAYEPPKNSYTRGPTPPPPAPYSASPYTPAGPDITFNFSGNSQQNAQGPPGGGGRDSGRGYGSAPPSGGGGASGGGASLAAAPFSVSYDSSYQVPPGKVAEAHKAARFAVSSLAFDDIPTAVSFLERSLKLLTDPKFTE